MDYKRAVTKQQDISHRGRQTSDDALRTLAATFNAAVAQCAQGEDPEAVHGLRTGSRRLQAMLEAALRDNPGTALEQSARAWLRQLKQIRRAAGPVRDLDVHRKLLGDWVGKTPPTPIAALGDPLCVQAERLDLWLKSQRKHLAQGMQKQIKKRQQVLPDRQTAFFQALGRAPLGKARNPRPADVVALEDFMRTADAMPLLHAENLHDFRKATKKARYVAESTAEGQTYSRVAKALKRIQDAIGEWHDWLCLSQEVRTALGRDAPELTAFINREVERHFATAMKTSQTMGGQLSGEWMASHAKRPPASVASADRRLASGF
jgi:CHAD domain-containing protein